MTESGVRRAGAVAEVVTDAERTVVLALDDRLDPRPVLLQGTAAVVWSRIGDEPVAVEELIVDVASAYEIAAGGIQPQVRDFVSSLVEQGLAVIEHKDAT